MKDYIWVEKQEVSCACEAGGGEGLWSLASRCPVKHTGFSFSVSPTTVGDFPNCKSSPFMKPTNSGWQHSLHRHTPHYSRPTLLQLLTVCMRVFTMFSLPSVIPEQLPGKTNKTQQNKNLSWKTYCVLLHRFLDTWWFFKQICLFKIYKRWICIIVSVNICV